ncbi:sulfotransferase [Hyphomonas sp.]|uniref:tetratricopeptide repeat-containing sulfotransferase family protein n=1 Tax=Hyphomonas sp. TaxID=87 RepID=UPI0033405BD3
MPNFSSPQEQHALQLKQAATLLAQQHYREAHALCMGVIRADPANAEAFYLLGLLTLQHANYAKAEEVFTAAIARDAGHAAAHAQRARCLIALSRRAEAVDAARRAGALSPPGAFTLDTIGVVLSRAGLHGEALAWYGRATAAEPGNADYQYNHGAALQFAGEMASAREAYRRCAAGTGDTRGLAALVQITRQSAEANEVAGLERLFAQHKDDPDAALRIGHALAKAFEDMQQPEAALLWLARAKAGKRARISHDAKADAALFDAAMGAAETVRRRTSQAQGAPVFICGMPRTGTTLVDRILSSHSALTSAGELTDFALCLKRMAKTPSNLVLDPATLGSAARVDLTSLGNGYMDSVRTSLGIESRFTDKMPLNILLAPVTLAALPGARVICLRRHPADTVLSNYRQMFATSFSYYNYAYTLEDTAHYYVAFDRMVRHFEAHLPPDRFTVVHYERIVADLETEARRLLDFCAMPFEVQCLSFHENAAPVATASSAQVREPLYTTALGRWKRYEAGLKPALDILEAAGCLAASERSCD